MQDFDENSQELLSTMTEAEQWSLLEKVVTTERVTRAIFRTLFKPHRNRLPGFDTLDDVINLIQSCNNIVILTGAGVSVSCGIPDFRSPGGMFLCLINLFLSILIFFVPFYLLSFLFLIFYSFLTKKEHN